LANLGVGSGIATKHFIENADPVYRAYKKHGNNFIFSLDHLEKLVNDSGISYENIEKILSENPEQEELYSLTAYSLLQRVKKNEEVSQKYNDYIDKMAELILSGTIKFKTTYHLKEAEHKMEYENVKGKGIIYIDPKKVLMSKTTIMIESTILHELFHGYQDYKKQMSPNSLDEAEAHLLQSDFILHVAPELIHENHWIQIYYDENSYNVDFLVPGNIVRSLSTLEEGHPIYEKNILIARQAYILFDLINGSVNAAWGHAHYSKLLKYEKELIYAAMEATIDELINELQMKPLREYMYDCKFGGPKNREVTCMISGEISRFSTAVDFLANYAGSEYDFHLMTQYYNQYFIEEWLSKKHSLLDTPYDRVMIKTGFK